ncbi:MAG: hypothetical protein AAB662_01910 [Patescibacteria group bacterium]
MSKPKFNKKTFDWKEIETEDTERPVPKVTRTGTYAYREEVHVQKNKFILKRNGDTASVACFSANGKERWTAKFPLKVDIGRIKAIFADSESDFRPLRTILPIELKMNE